MRIAVCDDNLQSRTRLEQTIKSYFVNKNYTLSKFVSFSNAEELLASLSAQNYFDIIFLDIEMPNMDGMACAKKIRNLSLDSFIIFVTNYDQYMRTAFSVEAFDYIEKPIICEKITPVLDRCLQKYKILYAQVLFSSNKEHLALYPKDILYVESFRKEIVFHLKNGETKTLTYKMGECEKQLANYGFGRCHLSYLVNFSYIQKIEKKNIFLRSSAKILPIGGRYYERFMDGFLIYQTQKRR